MLLCVAAVLAYIAVGCIVSGIMRWIFKGKDFVANCYWDWHEGNTFICTALWWVVVPIVLWVGAWRFASSVLPSPSLKIAEFLTRLEKKGARSGREG